MPTANRFTTRDIANLVRTYGGVLGAIEYGVTADRIDDQELASAWRRLEEHYESLRPILTIVNRTLSQSRRAA
ncbi:MAG: hypothetical protein WCK58_16540 [Chloroflexota bacterium]